MNYGRIKGENVSTQYYSTSFGVINAHLEVKNMIIILSFIKYLYKSNEGTLSRFYENVSV